jgi:hypothetical protein
VNRDRAANDSFRCNYEVQPVRAAKVRRDAREHVAKSTRDLKLRIAVNEQLSTIGHLAAPFGRTRDHLAGELPAPNCLHDKSALSAYLQGCRQSSCDKLGSGNQLTNSLTF